MKKDKPTSKERVEHILQAIEQINRFSEPHNLETFLQDDKTISACLYQFTIIGEAIRHIDYDLLEKYAYPWHKIKAFRNFILHEYHGIEMKAVWDTTTKFLPEVKEVMERILVVDFKD
jgi:uncharacterized protein with HEPN domain